MIAGRLFCCAKPSFSKPLYRCLKSDYHLHSRTGSASQGILKRERTFPAAAPPVDAMHRPAGVRCPVNESESSEKEREKCRNEKS